MAPARQAPVRLLLLLVLCTCHLVLSPAATVLLPSPEDEPQALLAVELYSQATLLVQSGDLDAGIASFRACISAYPHISGAYNNLAMLLFERSGDSHQALALLEHGLVEAAAAGDLEELATIHNNMGFVLREASGKHSIPHNLQAIEHFDAALRADPASVEAMSNKASALLSLGQSVEAEPQLLRALELRPDHAPALTDLSRIRFSRQDLDGAVELLDRIIQANDDTLSVLVAVGNKAVFLREAGYTLEALRAQLKALEVAPDHPRTLSNVMTMQRVLCDWNGLEELEDRLVAVVETQLLDTSRAFNGAEHYVSLLPYDSTLVRLSDAFRRRITVRYASSFDQPLGVDLSPSRWEIAGPKPTRLRVGYLSFDFREHPMGHLTLALVDTHDRRVVEVFCFSYGPDDSSEWRRRFEHRCDVFRDLQAATDLQAAQQIARDEVDVLVDLMTHTKGARQSIPALKPSRVVVNYLGFPGTTGSKATHFAVVDKLVVPPEVAAETMTERVVYLPATYQANQYEPEVAVCGACHHRHPTTDRDTEGSGRSLDLDAFAQCVADCQRLKRPLHGLPSSAIVFCNFNVNNKMDARSFALWVNILRQVPGSVLWLLAPHRSTDSLKPELDRLLEDDEDVRDAPESDSARVKQALRAQAAALGVSPSRIIFAPRVDKHVHLERVALADVFLDSIVYNAHSTASDALWAHVPLVTTWGDTFPSRVAASLVTNAVSFFSGSEGSEVVAHSLKEFEDLAVKLATDPTNRLRLRAELAAQSLKCPLFDTQRTTNGVERALEAMHDVKKLVADGERGDQSLSHVVVTPELSRVWSDPTVAQGRLEAMEQLAAGLKEAGDVVGAGNVAARVLLAGLQLQRRVSGGNDSDQPSISVSVETPGFTSVSSQPPTTNTSRSAAVSVDRLTANELEIRLNTHPADLDAFMELATWLMQRDRFPDVVRVFEAHGDRFLWLRSPSTSSPSAHDQEKAFMAHTFSLHRLGRTADAIALAERALARFDGFFQLGYNLGALYRAQGLFSLADAQQSAVAEAESRHAFHQWRDNDKLEKKRARRPKDAVVVAFYCNEYSQSWWGSWGPSTAGSTGLGGSEEAVVFLSQELAKLGYWVEVYGSPPPSDETLLDSNSSTASVSWYPVASYDPEDRDVDVFVAWRYSVSLAVGQLARRAFFWAHDVLTEDTLSSSLLATVAHRIVCVSTFQASSLPSKLRNKAVVLRNAVDDGFFTDGANDDSVFVYGSAPNRGLAQLLLAWPLVRSRLPNATLLVFYGFTPQFEAWARRHQWPRVTGESTSELTGFDEWREAMNKLLSETPGVTYVGLVDHSTLAVAYASSGFWLLPTAFSETSCISAMKAMANGAVPLTSRLEASVLGETIGAYDQGPVVMNATTLDDVEWWGTQWAERIVELVDSGEELKRLRGDMKQFARRSLRWSRVAREWHALITDELAD